MQMKGACLVLLSLGYLFKNGVTFVLVFSVGIGSGLSRPLKYLRVLDSLYFYYIYIFLVIE
jgi:hypothetical protein